MKNNSIRFLQVVVFACLCVCSLTKNVLANGLSQDTSIFKTYVSNGTGGPPFYQILTLRKDSTYLFITQADLIRKQQTGKWERHNNSLILHPDDTAKKMLYVKEIFDENLRRHTFTFSITDLSGTIINCDLYVKGIKKDTSLQNINGKVSVHIDRVRCFIISNIKQVGKYIPRSRKANSFLIRVNRDRQYFNEKWEFANNKLYPSPSKENSKYFLIEK